MKELSIRVCWFLLVSLLLVSCKSKTALIKEPAGSAGVASMVERVVSLEPRYKNMQISKLSFSIESDRYNFNFRATIKVMTDSIISVSILPMMGIEMVRLDMTPSGFLVVDKMNKRYAEGTYDYFKSKWGIILDYHSIESLLSNRLFTIPETTDSLNHHFTESIEDGFPLLVSDATVMGRNLDFKISQEGRIAECRLGSNSDKLMQVTYDDFKKFDRVLFPGAVQAVFNGPKQKIRTQFIIERIAFDGEMSLLAIDFSRYTKVTVTNILP